MVGPWRFHFQRRKIVWVFFMMCFRVNRCMTLNLEDSKESNPLRVESSHRALLQESRNVQALPPKIALFPENEEVLSTGSGSFTAISLPDSQKSSTEIASRASPAIPLTSEIGTSASGSSPGRDSERSEKSWAYVLVLPGLAFLVTLLAGMLVTLRTHENAAIGPWRTGLSGPLQKAFVTGVPKLNRPEVEVACEEFSNIVESSPDFIIFKGTLSSGVEIAVVSTAIESSKGWSKSSQALFRKKIDSLSRVNHKNFVNLLGYCEENKPFTRMIVYEYAQNGQLYDHLHVKNCDTEPLLWPMRMRIVMGIAYCLQHMHHSISPPFIVPILKSEYILLTDDFAAKITQIGSWRDVGAKGEAAGKEDFSELCTLPEHNVYEFGLLLLEIISGKRPYHDEQSSLVGWAAEYIADRRDAGYITDPALDSFESDELDVLCEVIVECVHPDPKRRPTMRDVAARLQYGTGILPESAVPRLSPLWWAELEILSEAS
ncbi:protein MALE DISCOVERER 2-like [Wolffia australiana]